MPTRIVKGLDIPIDGAPEQRIDGGVEATSVALLGSDYLGLRPSLQVEQGDRVKLGQPLLADRGNEGVVLTSPAGGVVSEINRGRRRSLASIVVRIEGDDEVTFSAWPEGGLAGLGRDQVVENLLASGLWTALRTRPYGKIPDPASEPAAIFVTAMDTNPLAALPEVAIRDHGADFANGLVVVSRLCSGDTYLCQAPGSALAADIGEEIKVAEFSGPHPAALVGTHMHHLCPVGARRTAWHLGYQDVVAIGKLFTTGRLWTERIVALAGPVVKRPRLIGTRLGANIDELVRDELEDVEHRVISGSVLSGRQATGLEGYLGRFHNQISVLAESTDEGAESFSIHGLFPPGYRPGRRFRLTTARHGRRSAMVPLGGFEQVMPLDILATQLLRALVVGDTDMAQALGCLELEEEDLALCTVVCPGKLDYGPMLREALTRIEKEG